MPKYAIHNEAGDILRTISVHEDFIDMQLQEGEFAFQHDDARWHDRVDVATGTLVKQDEPKPPEVPQWVKARRNAYPHYLEQLDMLWHAMDAGEIPKADRFYSAIKKIKDAIPKEVTAAPTVVYTVDPTPPEST